MMNLITTLLFPVIKVFNRAKLVEDVECKFLFLRGSHKMKEGGFTSYKWHRQFSKIISTTIFKRGLVK